MSVLEGQMRYSLPRAKALPRLLTAQPGELHGERVVAERFRLKQLLGRGAMGEVYRAYDLRERRTCAIKLICPGTERRLQIRSRSTPGASPLVLRPHPNIVTVYEMGQDQDGTRFLAMELLEGTDLKSMLRRSERLPLRQALAIARGAGMALQHAHEQGVVHRDLSPGSIFLCQRPAGQEQAAEMVKILDLSMASLRAEIVERRHSKSSHADELVTCEIMVGTPGYLPPEWACTQGGVCDPRGDQWSLAAILYQMVAGQVPFEWGDRYPFSQTLLSLAPRPLRELAPGLPEHFYEAVQVALGGRPEDRFASVGDFLRALDGSPRHLLEGRAVDRTLIDEVPLPQRLGWKTPEEEDAAASSAERRDAAPAHSRTEDVTETVDATDGPLPEPWKSLLQADRDRRNAQLRLVGDPVTLASSPSETLHEGAQATLPSGSPLALAERKPGGFAAPTRANEETNLLTRKPDVGSQPTQIAQGMPPAPSVAATSPPAPALPRRHRNRRSLRHLAMRNPLAWKPLRLLLFAALGMLAMSLILSLGMRAYWRLNGQRVDRRAQLAAAMREPDDDTWTGMRVHIPNHIPHRTWRPPYSPPPVRKSTFRSTTPVIF